MFREIAPLFVAFLLFLRAFLACAQPTDDAVRLTVTINPDGSKTIYKTNGANHQSVATTTGPDGKLREKIVYRLDGEGRYESGQVFAPNGALRFKTRYQYDAAGRLAEERQIAKDNLVLHRIVYSFDAGGHQSGYTVYDGAGKLLSRTLSKPPPQ